MRQAGLLLPEGGGTGGGRALRADLLRLSADPLEAPAHNNAQERTNREIMRRSRVVQVFPSTGSLVRLASAAMCEQDEIWQESRYSSEVRMNELYDEVVLGESTVPPTWTRLEAEARKMIESGFEFADRIEAA